MRLPHALRLALSLAAAAVLLMLGAGSAAAAFPGGNGRLLLRAWDGTAHPPLVTLNPDGSDPQIVPTGGVYPDSARWSPDGTRIAFDDYPNAGGDIWVVEVATGALTRVTTDPADEFTPTWSPDGTRIAFTRSGEGLVVRNLASGAETTLLSFADFGGYFTAYGRWAQTPAGGRLLVGADAPGTTSSRLYTVDAATGAATAITSVPLLPDTDPWSVYPGAVTAYRGEADWLPGGGRVAFRCALQKYTGEMCAVDVATGDVEVMTNTWPTACQLGGPCPDPDHRGLTVSPDGTAILTMREDFASGPGYPWLTVSDVDGGDPVAIPVPTPYSEAMDWQPIPGAGFPDADADGVADPIDTGAGTFADTGVPPTAGRIVDAAGLDVRVSDAAAPEGVRITVAGSGTSRARLVVCGFSLQLTAGSDAVVTCGSITVAMAAGVGEVTAPDGKSTVTVQAGTTVRVVQTTGGGISLQQVAGDPAAVRLFQGFAPPVDNGGVVNVMTAGRAVPLKWRLLDGAGRPVTDLTRASVVVTALACGAGAAVDQIEETLDAGSSLVNHGNGNYQLNWKTSRSYANTCRTLTLDLGGGVLPGALFRFR